MFVKNLKKSAASMAAAGTVLAVAGLTSTGATFQNVACTSGYPSAIATTTGLSVSKSVAEYGAKNSVTVKVSSTAGKPTGKVRIRVAGTTFDKTLGLSGGAASVALPRLSAGDTYTVRAAFTPDCSTGEFSKSSAAKYVTVVKGKTSVNTVVARNISRGGKPRVSGLVSAQSTVSPTGSVRVTISRGTAKATKTVSVEKIGGGDSSFRALFGRTVKRGTWDVAVKYLGNSNFKASTATSTFRVR